MAFFLLWSFFNLYHIIKFGFFDFTGKLNTGIFACLSIAIFFITFLLLKDVAWLDTFTFMDLIPTKTIESFGTNIHI